jgi:Tfp pilus assembly protein PilO
VTLSDRDRKILIALVPVVLLGAFWFLLLSPKRQEATTAADELAQQEERLDAARATAAAASNARTGFKADYTTVVRLGKAIPANVDMPSLLVQLDRAAAGTGIRFTSVATGDRQSVPVTAAESDESAPDDSTSGESEGSTPASEAGGQPAQTAPGAATESANEAAQAAEQQTDTQTSVAAKEGGLPVGGGAAGAGTTSATGAAAPAGLETVPLELQFVGDFFGLADFFHDVKRFVRVANQDVAVSGRLITIEGFRWTSDPEIFPRLQVEMTATIYLSPKAQGTTAGATPSGPDPTTSPTPTPADEAPAPATSPTAAATP